MSTALETEAIYGVPPTVPGSLERLTEAYSERIAEIIRINRRSIGRLAADLIAAEIALMFSEDPDSQAAFVAATKES